MSTNGAPKVSALLIGIDRYDSDLVPDLYGCLKDVSLMRTYLRKSAGISNISELTSPATSDIQVSPPHNLPTKDNVVAALEKLANEAEENDFIYIHFSGHGSRVNTEYKEFNPKQEDDCLVLVRDFKSTASRRVDYLRDMELVCLLKNITDKGAIVTIVLDCCHSGGATRGSRYESSVPPGQSHEHSITRGVNFLPENALVERKTVCQLSVLEQFRARRATNAVRSALLIKHWMTSSQGVEFFAACDSDQKAQEIRDEGGIYRGLLTECLLQVLRDHHNHHRPLTCGMIYNLVSSEVATHPNSTEKQTVVFGGGKFRFFFGAGWSEPNKTTVTRVMRPPNDEPRIELSAGKAHGVVEADIYALYPPDRTLISLMDYNSPSAVCRISHVDDFSSTAVVGRGLAGVSEGYKAMRRSEILEKHILAPRPVKLHLPQNTTTETRQLTKRLEKLNYEGSFVCLTDSESSFFQIHSDGTSCLKITWNLNGGVAIDVQTEAALLSHLRHLSIYHNLLDLTTFSECNSGLSVEKIGYLPSGTTPPIPRRHKLNGTAQVPHGLIPFDDSDPQKSDPQKMYENQSIGIRVSNNSFKKVFIEILDLEPSWQATKVYPIPGNNPTPVPAGEGVDFFLKMTMSNSVTHPRLPDYDTIIVLSTTNERGNFPTKILPQLSEKFSGQGSPLAKAESTRAAAGFDSEQWYAQRVDVRVLKSRS